MKNYFWFAIGIVVAVAAAIQLMRTVSLKKRGSLVLGEITEIREKTDRKGCIVSYIHRMRYEIGGKTLEKDDRAGFNQPFRVGEKHLIYVYSNDTSRFEYESQIKKNIGLYAALAVVAAIFAVRWLMLAK